MPKNALKVTAISHDPLCQGWHWEVADEGELALQVARIALGHYRHVAKILQNESDTPPVTLAEQVKDVVALLSMGPGEDPWHRDGWLFQAISWIAAHQTGANGVIRPPHLIKAHKGFDGIQLEFTEDGNAVSAVVIFEDKATDNPRKTIREDVWPSFERMEKGERITELVQETTALLDGQAAAKKSFDVSRAINSIIWNEARNYRVSITVGDAHSPQNKRQKLFKGFGDIVTGGVKRRRADTLHLMDLRAWMEKFAELVIQKAKDQESV